MENISDFEHLKAWQNNPDLDYYLSEGHWNFHVNQLLYKNLLVYHGDKEVGAFLDISRDSFTHPINDYSFLYGEMFNEAYRLCYCILSSPVPETKVAFFANQAATWKFRNLKDEQGKPIMLAPNVIDLIESYHILGMTAAFLSFANDQKDTIDRFLLVLSVYKDKGLPFMGFIHCFESYNEVYRAFIATTMISCSGLRPDYNYKRRDEHLRHIIPLYKNFAEELENNLSEANNNTDEEHGEHYYGKNVAIFHENLDPDKIARAIIAIDRKGIAIRHFCLILYTVFSSLRGCLTTTKKTKFIDWVKYNCKTYFESNDLKKIELSDDEKQKIEEYKAIFADKQLDGSWIFNKKFYRTDSHNNPLQSIEKKR